jgi:hypothetical protein
MRGRALFHQVKDDFHLTQLMRSHSYNLIRRLETQDLNGEHE